MTTEKGVPALKTTIQPITVASESAPEGATPVVPQTGEEIVESPEEKSPAEGAEPQKDDKAAPVEEYELFFEGEEEEKPSDHAFAQMRTGKAKAEAEAARLRRELEALKAPAGAPPDPGDEPTSEDCAFDEVELKKRLRKWDQDKAAYDAHKAKAADQERAQGQEIANRHNAYLAAGTELSKRPGYTDYPEAEKTVAVGMSEDRKIALLKYAKDPARVVYFLGHNPERLEELAKETDLGRFVAKLKDLEVGMKERKKNQAPPPEQSPRGSGAVNAGDTTIEKLRATAEKTGDYGPVNAYKRKLAAQRGQRERK